MVLAHRHEGAIESAARCNVTRWSHRHPCRRNGMAVTTVPRILATAMTRGVPRRRHVTRRRRPDDRLWRPERRFFSPANDHSTEAELR